MQNTYTVQYSTVQYSTVQYSTVQYSAVQYSAVQYSTVQYSTVQYSTVQYSIVQYSKYSKYGWIAYLVFEGSEIHSSFLLKCQSQKQLIHHLV